MSPRVRSILSDVAGTHGVTVDQLRSHSRLRMVSHARFDAMSRLRVLHLSPGRPRFSLHAIAGVFGLDHSTVVHGLRRAEQLFGVRAPIYPILDSEETRL